MRLDKFLKVSRIIKRRTVANDACDMGRIEINGKVAKACTEVRVGDVIKIRFGQNETRFEVLNVFNSVKKEDVSEMVKIIED